MVAAVDPLIGHTLASRYEVIRKLGEGGMGSVYLARHIVLEKEVALKVLHAEFARRPDLVERFMQEAKAASKIRHENVIDISDFGVTPDGYVFFAMELLVGHDLHEEIARAKLAGVVLPWERSRKIFLQVCSALAAAHARGIVHRDLKPENIYLVEFLGDTDFVKLLDFGIAKQTAVGDDGGDRKLTRTGMLFGTPEYMSPEQARGDKVDPRVDVYAMGCILFQLVVGRVPFAAENFMGILSLHLTEPPPEVSPAALAAAGAPPGIAAVIARALAKRREDRWSTIDEMANAIRALGERAGPAVPLPDGVRTQWVGTPQVPIEPTPMAPPRRSMAPWLGLVGAVVIGGGVAAYALTRDSGGAPQPPPPTMTVPPHRASTPAPPPTTPAVTPPLEQAAPSVQHRSSTATAPAVEPATATKTPKPKPSKTKPPRAGSAGSGSGAPAATPDPAPIKDPGAGSEADPDLIPLKKPGQ